jgi:hypothetical protein
MVRLAGVEPAASAMSARRSSVELEARAPGTIRTCECRCVKPTPWAAWRRERIFGALGKIRTSTVRGLKPPPATVGLPARRRGRHRTCTVQRLRPGLCRSGYAGVHKSTRAYTKGRLRPSSRKQKSGHARLSASWCAGRDSNPHCLPSEGSASCQLGYRRKKSPQVSNLPLRLTKAVTCLMIERSVIGARSIELNVHLSRYKPEALPVELCGLARAGLARFAPTKLVLAAGVEPTTTRLRSACTAIVLHQQS